MSDDFLLTAAEQRLKVLNAARQRAVADLAEAQSMEDAHSAGIEIQTIANLDAEAANLTNLAQRHVRSQQAPAAPRPDAWRTKRLDEMQPEDAMRMIRETSKYGKDLDFNDPNVQRGWQELQNRKARGE